MILSPLSALYGKALSMRAQWYASGRLESHALPRPSISVGNLTFGGTGKTPFVEFLARRLRFEGWRPAILSRGYGRRSRGVVVVGAGEGALVSPDEGGDEPVALARATSGVLVVVGERRADAARRAADLGADLFLLDDAFQHLAVRRDVNLLLLDARDPFGGGRLPPAGRLREPIAAARRADAFIFTRVDRAAPAARGGPGAPAHPPRGAGLSCAHPALGSSRRKRRADRRRGIRRSALHRRLRRGQSGGVRRDAIGARACGPRSGSISGTTSATASASSRGSASAAERTGASLLVTTEKDAVKLAGRTSLPIVTVRLAVEVAEPGFFAFLASRLPAAGPQRA